MLAALMLSASLGPLDVQGVWEVKGGDALVEITSTDDGSVRGEIIWYRGYEDEIVFDERNPEPDLRDKEILGLAVLDKFERTKKKWRRGKIYDPTDGKSYRSAISRLDEDTLAVEGCIGFICITQKWARVPEQSVVRADRDPVSLAGHGL